MLANPAWQAVLMFLVGSALALGDLHSKPWAYACWGLTGILLVVALVQWSKWPGSYGRRLAGWANLRWGKRIALKEAAQIIYAEARAQDSMWAHAAKRMSLDKSPEGILCYIAEVIKQDTTFYGKRQPSTHVERLDPMQAKYGTVTDSATQLRMRDNTKAVFVDLEIDKAELRRALEEVRSNLKTTTPI